MRRLDLPTLEAVAADIRAMCGDDTVTFLDTLDGETDVMDVLASMLDHAQESASIAAAARDRARQISDRAARMEQRARALREGMRRIMDAIGEAKITLPEATVSVTPGRPRVVITDPDAVPTQMSRIKREPDKAAILKAMQAGEAIPGAAIETGPDTLTVRTA